MCTWAFDGLDTGGGLNLHFVDSFFLCLFFCVLPPPCSPELGKHTDKQMDCSQLRTASTCLIGKRTLGVGGACWCRAGSPRSQEASHIVQFLATGQASMADPEFRPIVAWGLPTTADPHTGDEHGQR